MIWEKKKILEHLADEYLHTKYPKAKAIHLKEYRKVFGDGYKPLLQKDYASSTRLEARFPYQDSRAMTRTPSPLACRPDFPGAPREAH